MNYSMDLWAVSHVLYKERLQKAKNNSLLRQLKTNLSQRRGLLSRLLFFL